MVSFLLRDMNLLAFALFAVALVLGAALWLYHRQIGDLLDRVWSRPESERPQVSQQTGEIAAFRPQSGVEPESKEASTVAGLLLQEAGTRNSDKDVQLQEMAVFAANQTLRAEFELRFRQFYKSQIEALLAIRQKGPHPLDEHYRRFLTRFEERKDELEKLGLTTPSFEDWVQFLTIGKFPLIALNSGIATITDRGDAFVEFYLKAPPWNHGL